MGPAGFLLPDDATAAERMQIAFGHSGGWMDLSRGMERERDRRRRRSHRARERRGDDAWVLASLGRADGRRLGASRAMSIVDADRDLRAEVEQLLFLEARLADESRYEEWLALMTDDVRYWVPSGPADYDPDTRISFVNDNRSRLETRVAPAPHRCPLRADAAVTDAPGDLQPRDRVDRHDDTITAGTITVGLELRAVRAVGAGDERAAHLGRTGHASDPASRRRAADRGEDGRAGQRLAAAADAGVPAVSDRAVTSPRRRRRDGGRCTSCPAATSATSPARWRARPTPSCSTSRTPCHPTASPPPGRPSASGCARPTSSSEHATRS